ncbi:MAG: hypothetical protein L0229_23310 [Blastocatellia bacterium]|nr:hypothetical protein [Blastocatellia bacterium]
MIPKQVRKILQLLLIKSKTGKVNWLSAADLGVESRSEEDYSVITPDATVNLWKNKNDSRIYGRILNSKGISIFSFDSSDDENDSKLLNSLFDEARTSALKTDETLEGLLDFLEKNLKAESVIGEPSLRDISK